MVKVGDRIDGLYVYRVDGAGVHVCDEAKRCYRLNQAPDEPVIEMLTALSRKIVSLEQQLRDIQRNVETWAQQTENVKNLSESNEQDIAMIDDRLLKVEDRTQFETVTIPRHYYEQLVGDGNR